MTLHNFISKEDFAIALTETFVENKFVKLHTKDLGNVERDSVEKNMKVYLNHTGYFPHFFTIYHVEWPWRHNQ